MIGGFLFLERLFEKRHNFVVSEQPRPRDAGSVGANLVMLGALGGRDQGSVHRGRLGILFHQLGALFDDAGHAVTGLGLRRHVERAEDVFEARDMLASLFEMRLERVAQTIMRRRLGHFG